MTADDVQSVKRYGIPTNVNLQPSPTNQLLNVARRMPAHPQKRKQQPNTGPIVRGSNHDTSELSSQPVDRKSSSAEPASDALLPTASTQTPNSAPSKAKKESVSTGGGTTSAYSPLSPAPPHSARQSMIPQKVPRPNPRLPSRKTKPNSGLAKARLFTPSTIITVDPELTMQSYADTLREILEKKQADMDESLTPPPPRAMRFHKVKGQHDRVRLNIGRPLPKSRLPKTRSDEICETTRLEVSPQPVKPEPHCRASVLESTNATDTTSDHELSQSPPATAHKTDTHAAVTFTTLNQALVSTEILNKFGILYETHPNMQGTITIQESLSGEKLRMLLELTRLSQLCQKLEIQDESQRIQKSQSNSLNESGGSQDIWDSADGTQDGSCSGLDQHAAMSRQASIMGVEASTEYSHEGKLMVPEAEPLLLAGLAHRAPQEFDAQQGDVHNHVSLELGGGDAGIGSKVSDQTGNFWPTTAQGCHESCSAWQAGEIAPHTDTESVGIQMDELNAASASDEQGQDQNTVQIANLKSQIMNLQNRVTELSSALGNGDGDPSPWPVLHRIYCPRAHRPAIYLDKPVCIDNDEHQHLDARRRIANEDEWEDRQVDTPFVVYLDYRCKTEPEKSSRKANRLRRPGGQQHDSTDADGVPVVAHFRERVHILSDALREALDDVFASDEDFACYRPQGFDDEGILSAPFIFNFQYPQRIEELLYDCGQHCLRECGLFLSYIREQTANEECSARQLFERGTVTPRYMPYLFAPGELLLKNDKHMTATKLLDTIRVTGNTTSESDNEDEVWKSWTLRTESIAFDGRFLRKPTSEWIDCSDIETKEICIHDLPVYPIKFASDEGVAYLMRRGQFYFSCRNGRFVVGPAENDGGLVSSLRLVN